MAPLVLEGDTLGKRHQHFNKQVNNALAKKVPFEEIKTQKEKSDIDRLFKIDLAGKNRIVDYILETFKSDDMLYVSRAIKQSTWLITDQQYAHIVNAQYLNDVLFPEMTAKASCKFMLHVRLNLKDEERIEQFYKFYESKDLSTTALKWLPNCSLEFIKEIVRKRIHDIDKDLFKRLCERSIDVLDLFVEKSRRNRKNTDYTQSVMFLMKTDVERYMNIVEKITRDVCCFKFGPKYTQLILKKCPERIMEKFDKYAFSIDPASLGKHLGVAKAQEFLLKHVKNEKISSWYTYDNIAKFVGGMPKEEKFEFIKKVFIDKTAEKTNDDDQSLQDAVAYMEPETYSFRSIHVKRRYAARRPPKPSNKNIYQWYKHAPFGIAFTELKKLIRAESSPDERTAMMSVMLIAAGSNVKNVEAVLQYYHDRHINEPFKFKMQFVDHLLAATKAHRFEEKSWKLLDELFHSMEVYIETDNRVTKCINNIILYKVLHDESIPDAVEKKFVFNSFKESIKKLNQLEKEKIFKYLNNYIEQKIEQLVITNQDEFDTAISLVNDIFNFLLDWNKELIDNPVLLQKVKEIISMKKEKSWTGDIASLFDKKKSWRKHLFEESLLLSPSEEGCLNALKHDPNLLKRYASEIDVLRYDDNISLKKLLSKLRIYWPQSLGSEWVSAYRGKLEQTGGHKAVIRALCALLPPEELLPIIKRYAPENHKIVWSEVDQLEISLQKSIAMSMHTARPPPPPEAVLWYAKGDYLQFALPSFSAIFYNLSAARCRQHFPRLLNAPVSVQKHGIRLAFFKMTFQELKETLTKTWTSTKNSSIRTVIFQLTHDLLCREKSPDNAEALWQLLEMLIDNLSHEENKIIYTLVGKASPIPTIIRPKYLVKSYKFLKTLPAKFECKDEVESLVCYTSDIMDKIDPAFIKEIIMEHFEQFYVKDKCRKSCHNIYNNVITSYLIWGQTEEAQNERYEDVFVPIMKYAFQHWGEIHEKRHVVRNAFNDLINAFFTMYTTNIFKTEIEVPVKLFKNILQKMEEMIPLEKNYKLLRIWQMKVAFVIRSAEARSKMDLTKCTKPDEDEEADVCGNEENDQWKELCTLLIPDFGAQCIHYLKEDVATSPIFYVPFEDALTDVINSINFNQQLQHALYDIFLSDEEFIFGYLVVLRNMPNYCYDEADKKSLAKYLQRIKAHPSVVVQMQYDIKFYDYYEY